jgi:hypothetical protein
VERHGVRKPLCGGPWCLTATVKDTVTATVTVNRLELTCTAVQPPTHLTRAVSSDAHAHSPLGDVSSRTYTLHRYAHTDTPPASILCTIRCDFNDNLTRHTGRSSACLLVRGGDGAQAAARVQQLARCVTAGYACVGRHTRSVGTLGRNYSSKVRTVRRQPPECSSSNAALISSNFIVCVM